jgi:uncharacterized protein
MNLLDKFDIDIAKLGLGQHHFSFKIDQKFFELFDYSLVDRGDLDVKLELEKKTSFIALNYQISGTIELVCDRSLDQYDYPLDIEEKVILKYGEEPKELTDEIEIISYNTQKINVSNHIYEFISVAVPMKKLHPRYDDETPDDQIIYSSSKDEESGQEIDPRWSELKKLKGK